MRCIMAALYFYLPHTGYNYTISSNVFLVYGIYLCIFGIMLSNTQRLSKNVYNSKKKLQSRIKIKLNLTTYFATYHLKLLSCTKTNSNLFSICFLVFLFIVQNNDIYYRSILSYCYRSNYANAVTAPLFLLP